ncbi:hypothetical protein FRB91_010265 [Serendipita sp. 411]|nr:hypothetical protein FRB91_010265 [Serendipita sp. 411]
MIPITDGSNNCTPPPNNPDVQGFVVRLSLTLLVFSRKGIRTVVGSLLLQNYIILIASLVFIHLEKLSPNDIHFVIGAVNSPVFHMLV